MQKSLHGACVRARELNTPVLCRNGCDSDIRMLPSQSLSFRTQFGNPVSIIEFGVNFDKFQGTNRRLSSIIGRNLFVSCILIVLPRIVTGSIFSTILTLVSISLGITGRKRWILNTLFAFGKPDLTFLDLELSANWWKLWSNGYAGRNLGRDTKIEWRDRRTWNWATIGNDRQGWKNFHWW